MPNYYAHTWFGQQVLEQMPEEACQVVAADPVAYQGGLYGPDPVLFTPGCRKNNHKLHATWRDESWPTLCEMFQGTNAGARSFAAGYLCHLLLDDACHPIIYRWMEAKGLSHLSQEVGLDWLLAKEGGKKRFPTFEAHEKGRLAHYMMPIIGPTKSWQYRIGLRNMNVVCWQLAMSGRFYLRKVGDAYREPLEELRHRMEETVKRTAKILTTIYRTIPVQEEEGLLALASC